MPLFVVGGARAQSPAQVDQGPGAQQLRAVPRRAGERPVVTIYEFRSAVPEIQVGAAQEMFVTALVRSGAFTVAERQRLSEGVMRERQLAQQGVTAGGAGGQVQAARYVFEVVVSEANAGASESAQGVNIGGMRVQSARAADAIGMDVRIVDAASGTVVDAVNVVKKIEAGTTSVSGVGSLLNQVSALRGRNVLPVPVDAESRSSRKESVDRALRSCIEVAVAELARRLNTN
ncbi:MAG: CsgG/HfaB family protein [Burkholderiaceae bacterium]|nr:CsgG/HfaB family protein [Burkholderiaceae bacterium]